MRTEAFKLPAVIGESAVWVDVDIGVSSWQSLTDADIEALLQAEIAFARRAPINGFPSLLLQTPEALHVIELDCLDAAPMRRQIEAALGGVN